MRKIFIQPLEHELEHDQECPKSHEPNKITKRALENVEKGKGLHTAATIEDLFKTLNE